MSPRLWNNELSRMLLEVLLEQEVLLEEIQKGNYRQDWKKIVKKFNAQTQLNVTDRQAANHVSDLKGKYKAWKALKSMTGFSFHPVSGLVCFEECHLERWNEFVQKYNRYGPSLATTPLKNVDLLKSICDGYIETDVMSYSPALPKSQTLKKSVTGKGKTIIVDDGEGYGDSEDPCVHKTEKQHDIGLEESKSPPKTMSINKRKSDLTLFTASKWSHSIIDKAYDVLRMIQVQAEEPTKVEKVYDALTKLRKLRLRMIGS